MITAIIDLGTNTFNILIVNVNQDTTYDHLFQTKISVKLGEGGINTNFIADLPFKRGIEALKEYKKEIERFKVEKVIAFATSAIRGASNSNEFLTKAKQETGIDIQLISGSREAELIYYGVRQAVKLTDEVSLIIDIGGGSTEFIIADKNTIFWKQSFLLGASRLLEMFHPSDRITDTEHLTIANHLSQELQPLMDAVKQYPVKELIGSSGSFDSLAEMIAHKFYTPEILRSKREYEFVMSDFHSIYDLVLKSDNAGRLQMKGLIAMRVDMIVISSIIVDFVIRSLSITKMRQSSFALKEGILHELMNSPT